MKVLLDACVIYPTVLREVLLGVAKADLFEPLWTVQILDEWTHAAERNGIGAQAHIERALLESSWKKACVTTPVRDDLILPDMSDVHVLSAAIGAEADVLLTVNLKDFPTRILIQNGVIRQTPDVLLCDCFDTDPDAVRTVVLNVHQKALSMSDDTKPLKVFLKSLRLPRLAKLLIGSEPLAEFS